MAGDWIKWTKGLAKKPEVIMISVRLSLSRHTVAGLLMEVWEWADDNVVLKMSGSEPDPCPGVVPFTGQPEHLFTALTGVAGLADAMTAVGWLTIRNGSLVFPNFGRHNGKSAKARALDTTRKHQSRNTPSFCPVDVMKMSGSEPDKKRTRGEERREEVKTEPPNPPTTGGEVPQPPPPLPKPKRARQAPQRPESVPIPTSLDIPEFRGAWADWLADRKTRGKPVTELAARQQLQDCESWGLADAIASVRKAIASGWTGIYRQASATSMSPRAQTTQDQILAQVYDAAASADEPGPDEPKQRRLF